MIDDRVDVHPSSDAAEMCMTVSATERHALTLFADRLRVRATVVLANPIDISFLEHVRQPLRIVCPKPDHCVFRIGVTAHKQGSHTHMIYRCGEALWSARADKMVERYVEHTSAEVLIERVISVLSACEAGLQVAGVVA